MSHCKILLQGIANIPKKAIQASFVHHMMLTRMRKGGGAVAPPPFLYIKPSNFSNIKVMWERAERISSFLMARFTSLPCHVSCDDWPLLSCEILNCYLRIGTTFRASRAAHTSCIPASTLSQQLHKWVGGNGSTNRYPRCPCVVLGRVFPAASIPH